MERIYPHPSPPRVVTTRDRIVVVRPRAHRRHRHPIAISRIGARRRREGETHRSQQGGRDTDGGDGLGHLGGEFLHVRARGGHLDARAVKHARHTRRRQSVSHPIHIASERPREGQASSHHRSTTTATTARARARARAKNETKHPPRVDATARVARRAPRLARPAHRPRARAPIAIPVVAVDGARHRATPRRRPSHASFASRAHIRIHIYIHALHTHTRTASSWPWP